MNQTTGPTGASYTQYGTVTGEPPQAYAAIDYRNIKNWPVVGSGTIRATYIDGTTEDIVGVTQYTTMKNYVQILLTEGRIVNLVLANLMRFDFTPVDIIVDNKEDTNHG